MKTRTKITLFISSLVLLGGSLLLSPSIAYALPYGTESWGPDAQLAASPACYVPDSLISIPHELLGTTNINLTKPQDMFIDNDTGLVYVADTGNKRIAILSIEDSTYFNEIKGYTPIGGSDLTIFKEPTGVCVNSTHVFVADESLGQVIIFDKATLMTTQVINRPNSILVGSTTVFAPTKVKADNAGNIYATLRGCTKGVMQLDYSGEFISYIGANPAEVTFLNRLQAFFGIISNDYLLTSGAPVTNIALDNKGLLYTVSGDYKGHPGYLKKLNTTGNTIMTLTNSTTTSAFISSDGNIYSIQSNGYVTAYDSYGSLLFRFGGKNKTEILGALNAPISGGLYKDGTFYLLDANDGGVGLITKYNPTEFAKLVYRAVNFYKDGIYLGEAEEVWKELLQYNSKFILAYRALARASMKRGDYDTALKQFKLAEDKAGYSDAFWQIRDRWIRANLGWVLLPIAILIVLVVVIKFVDKKVPTLFTGVKTAFGKFKAAPVVNETGLMFTFVRHPRDTIYEIKFKKRARIIGAIFLYVFFVVIQILKVYLTGYLFNDVGRADGIKTVLMSTLPILLLVVCNYYVSSVRDGEGKLRDIFVGVIYALSPYLIFAIPMFLISNIVTYNEEVIYHMLWVVIYAWCGINVILTIMELHDYSFWKALINILLTVICAVLIVAFVVILYVLGYQLITYLIGAGKEIILR